MTTLQATRPVSDFFASTWLNKKAVTRTVYKNSNKNGIRISVMHWVQDGTTEIRVIKGDGRTPNFEELESLTLTPAEAEHEEAVVDCLTQKWFA